MTKGLFVFRRDLRAADNRGLIAFSKLHESISCIFCLDPKQINPKQNKYFSATAVMFMIDSLVDLKSQIDLTVLHGDPEQVIENLIKKYKFDAVGFNEDYTPYARARDAAIPLAVKYSDLCLNDPNQIKPYKVFTPYYIAASQIKVSQPDKTKITNVVKLKEKSINLTKLKEQVAKIAKNNGTDLSLVQPGGRENGLKCIKNFKCNKYEANRDRLTYETSRLGPHLKFGTVSPREVYYACRDGTFRKQLYWRDFYTQISYHFKVYGYNFKNEIKWLNDKAKFLKWCNGETGFDIVDACMNQLNKSGFMHNRGRMIVASFLTKLLHIDWRWGERYFATRLTDYDPANNNGGWQWSAGTGVDAQPYFRIFNPYTQADKFDPDGGYRKKWLGDREIPEMLDYTKERAVALKLIK